MAHRVVRLADGAIDEDRRVSERKAPGEIEW
jgi:hypothetical protein